MTTSLELLALAKLSFWDNKPTAYLYQTAAQSVASGTTFSTAVAFDTTSDDNWSGHSNVTNNSRYTAQVAGLYKVSVSVTYTNTTGLLVRAVEIAKNGTAVPGAASYNQSYSNNFLTAAACDVVVRLVVGDYVQALTWQNSGGALNTVPAATYMSVEYLHV